MKAMTGLKDLLSGLLRGARTGGAPGPPAPQTRFSLPQHLLGEGSNPGEVDEQTGSRLLTRILRDRFEGRQAILVDKGALRVRVTGVEASLRGRWIRADVEEIPTPGLEKTPIHPFHPRGTVRFGIRAGYQTRVSATTWTAGYGGFSLFFAPGVVRGVIDLGAGFPEKLGANDRYSEVIRWLQAHDAHERAERVFATEASQAPRVDVSSAARSGGLDLRGAVAAMRENVAFVLDRLDSTDAPQDLTAATRVVFEENQRVLVQGMEARIRILEGAPGDVEASADDIADPLEHLAARQHQLVLHLRSAAGPRTALLATLVQESAANILGAKHQALRALEILRTERPPPPVPARGEGRRLECSVCGEIAAAFEFGQLRVLGEGFFFRGITRQIRLGDDQAKRIFARLDRGDLDSVHTSIPEGIDAYCPRCKRVFCRTHYQVEEVHDEGFYDASYGTCPAGHRRMIDD